MASRHADTVVPPAGVTLTSDGVPVLTTADVDEEVMTRKRSYRRSISSIPPPPPSKFGQAKAGVTEDGIEHGYDSSSSSDGGLRPYSDRSNSNSSASDGTPPPPPAPILTAAISAQSTVESDHEHADDNDENDDDELNDSFDFGEAEESSSDGDDSDLELPPGLAESLSPKELAALLASKRKRTRPYPPPPPAFLPQPIGEPTPSSPTLRPRLSLTPSAFQRDSLIVPPPPPPRPNFGRPSRIITQPPQLPTSHRPSVLSGAGQDAVAVSLASLSTQLSLHFELQQFAHHRRKSLLATGAPSGEQSTAHASKPPSPHGRTGLVHHSLIPRMSVTQPSSATTSANTSPTSTTRRLRQHAAPDATTANGADAPTRREPLSATHTRQRSGGANGGAATTNIRSMSLFVGGGAEGAASGRGINLLGGHVGAGALSLLRAPLPSSMRKKHKIIRGKVQTMLVHRHDKKKDSKKKRGDARILDIFGDGIEQPEGVEDEDADDHRKDLLRGLGDLSIPPKPEEAISPPLPTSPTLTATTVTFTTAPATPSVAAPSIPPRPNRRTSIFQTGPNALPPIGETLAEDPHATKDTGADEAVLLHAPTPLLDMTHSPTRSRASSSASEVDADADVATVWPTSTSPSTRHTSTTSSVSIVEDAPPAITTRPRHGNSSSSGSSLMRPDAAVAASADATSAVCIVKPVPATATATVREESPSPPPPPSESPSPLLPPPAPSVVATAVVVTPAPVLAAPAVPASPPADESDDITATYPARAPPRHISGVFPYRKILRAPLRSVACLQPLPADASDAAKATQARMLQFLLDALRAHRADFRSHCLVALKDENADLAHLLAVQRMKQQQQQHAAAVAAAAAKAAEAEGTHLPPNALVTTNHLVPNDAVRRDATRKALRRLARHAEWNTSLHNSATHVQLQLEDLRRRMQLHLPSHAAMHSAAQHAIGDTTAVEDLFSMTTSTTAGGVLHPNPNAGRPIVSLAEIASAARTLAGTSTGAGTGGGSGSGPSGGSGSGAAALTGLPTAATAAEADQPSNGGLKSKHNSSNLTLALQYQQQQLAAASGAGVGVTGSVPSAHPAPGTTVQRFTITKINRIRKNTPRILEIDLATKTMTICKREHSRSKLLSPSNGSDDALAVDDEFSNRDIVISAGSLVSASLHAKNELQCELGFIVSSVPTPAVAMGQLSVPMGGGSGSSSGGSVSISSPHSHSHPHSHSASSQFLSPPPGGGSGLSTGGSASSFASSVGSSSGSSGFLSSVGSMGGSTSSSFASTPAGSTFHSGSPSSTASNSSLAAGPGSLFKHGRVVSTFGKAASMKGFNLFGGGSVVFGGSGSGGSGSEKGYTGASASNTGGSSKIMKNWKILFSTRAERERFYRLLQVTLLTPDSAAASPQIQPRDDVDSHVPSTAYPHPQANGTIVMQTYAPRAPALTQAILAQVRVLPLLPLASSLHSVWCLNKKAAGWRYGLKLSCPSVVAESDSAPSSLTSSTESLASSVATSVTPAPPSPLGTPEAPVSALSVSIASTRKTHPFLVPFHALPLRRRDYNLKIVTATLATVLALGFVVRRPCATDETVLDPARSKEKLALASALALQSPTSPSEAFGSSPSSPTSPEAGFGSLLSPGFTGASGSLGGSIAPELLHLVDFLAESAHDLWSEDKLHAGWRYGPRHSYDLKTHPSIQPYQLLDAPAKEKERNQAYKILATLAEWGYCVVRDPVGANGGVAAGSSALPDDGYLSSGGLSASATPIGSVNQNFAGLQYLQQQQQAQAPPLQGSLRRPPAASARSTTNGPHRGSLVGGVHVPAPAPVPTPTSPVNPRASRIALTSQTFLPPE